MNDYQRILDYWFGALSDGWTLNFEERNHLWFGADKKDDADMKKEFGALVEAALANKLEKWRHSPESLMAYILLLDQMTRAIFRGTPNAFAGDKQALAACKEGIAQELDFQLPPLYCRFYYLPLEHSESLDDQKQCVVAFDNMRQRFARYDKEFIDSVYYAQKHLEIIERFGRFPHRNAILGRESTDEEKEYLAADAPNFGQKTTN